MSDELKNVVITVTDIQKKLTKSNDPFYKLKGADGQGSYNLFTKTRDGGETVAFRGFKALENEGLGQSVEIGYAESSYDYQGKTVISRNIRTIKPATTAPTTAPASVPTQTNVTAPVSYKPEEPDWDGIAWGKCKHAFLVEMFKKRDKLTVDDEQEAELYADMSMGNTREDDIPGASEQPEIPSQTPAGEDINVEGIPF